MSDFTALQKAEAADREVKMRERVYPNQVVARRMTQQQADTQIAVMKAIAADYRELAKKEQLL